LVRVMVLAVLVVLQVVQQGVAAAVVAVDDGET
jgi:hypothetical protein